MAGDRAEGAKDVIDAGFQHPFRALLAGALSEGNGSFNAMANSGMESSHQAVKAQFDGANPFTVG